MLLWKLYSHIDSSCWALSLAHIRQYFWKDDALLYFQYGVYYGNNNNRVLCNYHIWERDRGGGGGGYSPLKWTGVPLGGENLTLSQTARRTKNTPCHNIPNTKSFYLHTLYWYRRTIYSAVYHHTFIKICCRPARHRCWCRDREPVINIVGREATLW